MEPAIQAYLASTAMVDELIGQIVETLEDSKYADNTIIVLWSDHGFQLGEKGRWGKYSLWERATRVNLMWSRGRDHAGNGLGQAGEPAGYLSNPGFIGRARAARGTA